MKEQKEEAAAADSSRRDEEVSGEPGKQGREAG